VARKAIKDIESVEYKALDDWVLAYEAVSNLQMKDFGPDAKLADLQQHAGVAHSKGYNMELDQGRSFVRLHANASLRDMDLQNWIASSMPTSSRTGLDPASPRMGTVAARFGGDLGNYKVQLHGCFFNNSFFALMKGGATTKEQLKHVIKAFVDATKSNKGDLVKKDDLELMAPVEKATADWRNCSSRNRSNMVARLRTWPSCVHGTRNSKAKAPERSRQMSSTAKSMQTSCESPRISGCPW
jgi:hypothetical protein